MGSAGRDRGGLANVGVIAGIVFLAYQLAQNNQLMRAQARTDRAGVRIDAGNQLTRNPSLISAIVKDQNGDALTADEEYLLEEWYMATLVRLQYVYTEYQNGLLEHADMPVENWRLIFTRNPAMGTTWEKLGEGGFRPDFLQFMKENVVPGP